ncbi:PP2C family protein-serine/threonine phosphatase [Streptomyces sp. NPDC003393]
MPPPLSANRPAAQPPGRGAVDALISQARRLRGEVDAVRQETRCDTADPRGRWERALCDLALHQLRDLGEHLAQLRDGPPPVPAVPGTATNVTERADAHRGPLLSRVGSAEWNLLTDEAGWSAEFYRILGRDPATPALTLDELPCLALDEDRCRLTAMITDCLVDARLIDGEFRVVRPDGTVRTVHMMGEPVVGTDGATASMWAVLRDVSELRRSQSTVRETRDVLQHHRDLARTEHRLAAELKEAVLPSWQGGLLLPRGGRPALDLAASHLPASAGAPVGGDWYDAQELSDGELLLGVGRLAGHGPGAASGTAMLLGALRGLAMAGTAPGPLLTALNRLPRATAEPALGGAVCCRYRPATRTLVWARAGHPAPLLFRDGTGRTLDAPEGVPLGATPGAAYGQAKTTLCAGDLLVLHTDALVPGHGGTAAVDRLLALAPRLGAARSARDCVRTLVAEFTANGRTDDACVLVARVTT